MTENHHLTIAAGYHVLQDVQCLIHLSIVPGFLIEDVSTVAYHAHLAEEQQHTFPVNIAEIVHAAPFVYKLGYPGLELVMQFSLFRSQRHEQVLVGPFRHLHRHLGLPSADKSAGEFLPYLVEILI